MECSALNIVLTLKVTLRSSHPYKRRILHDWSYKRLIHCRPASGGEDVGGSGPQADYRKGENTVILGSTFSKMHAIFSTPRE